MDMACRLHLLLDGLVRGGEHGAHPALRLVDGTATEGQAKVLLKLQLYLAGALMEGATLQGNVTELIGAHWPAPA